MFAGAAIMELPTFVLALSMLVPALRSDLLFTGLFFVTRILYHIVLRESIARVNNVSLQKLI